VTPHDTTSYGRKQLLPCSHLSLKLCTTGYVEQESWNGTQSVSFSPLGNLLQTPSESTGKARRFYQWLRHPHCIMLRLPVKSYPNSHVHSLEPCNPTYWNHLVIGSMRRSLQLALMTNADLGRYVTSKRQASRKYHNPPPPNRMRSSG